jgi:tetratricopeptide (TPR) repeat protein
MKAILLTVLVAIAGLSLYAQNLDKAKEFLKANKLTDAKTQIDGVLADAKNAKNAEAWFYKSKIYEGIAASDQLKAQFPDARAQAFEALKNYVAFDDKKLILLQLDQYKVINEIYQSYFQLGAADYNSGKYSDALQNFQGAIAASTFMVEKSWINMKIDTTSNIYAGISAEKAKKRDTAAIYYGRLADAKVAGNNMIEIYKWLSNYYSTDKNDQANALKYLDIGKELYPNDSSWKDLEVNVYENQLDIYRKSGNKDSLFAAYDRVVAKFPNNNIFLYNYGLEMYQYASDTTKRPANADELVNRAKDILNKSLQIKPDYPQASLILGEISYNEAVDMQAKARTIKGSTPDAVKKRTDLRDQAMKKYEESIPHFQKVEEDLGSKGKLRMDDKTALRNAYDSLVTIYEQKKQKDKSDAYTLKYNNIDKDH